MTGMGEDKFTYDVDGFRETFEHDFTWLNGFLRNVKKMSNKPALYDGKSGASWTYSELNRDANKLAHAFLDEDVRRNDVIMYMLFNSPEFAFTYIASQKAGVINCPINFRLAPGEIALQLEDSQPKIFIYDIQFRDVVYKALELSRYIPKKIIVCGNPETRLENELSFEEFVSGRKETNPELSFRPNIYDEITRLYTSGTTNRAKAVPVNNINEVLSAHDVIMHFPLNSTDRTMNMTPWFHRGGLHSGGLTPTLYCGGEVVILREFNPRHCLELIENRKVNWIIGVPSIIALLARTQENIASDISSLKGIVTMGSPFEKRACEYYMKLFTPNIFNGYGTTETFWNTFLRPYNLPERSGSAGQCCLDDDVRIVRIPKGGGRGEPDDLVARDSKEIGEIIIRSPAKSAGSYVNNEEMSKAKFYKGYHYTGDLGTWDSNEFITIVSRKDDMIISAGENIYPSQIEAIIQEHPGVSECAVIGVPDQRHGQIVAAYVVPLNDELTVEELKAFCKTHPMLPNYKRPRVFNIVKELPHTATGKIMHYKLREAVKKNSF